MDYGCDKSIVSFFDVYLVILGDIDPYPNFDLSKIVRPGFENSEELKTCVVWYLT
jgi:hypothetical protein